MTLAAKTLTGPRAVLVNGATGGEIAVFDSIETGVDQTSFVPFVLGRASGGEIVLMNQEPIMIRLSGFRKIGSGPYAQGAGAGFAMNKLQDLLADVVDYAVMIYDRQNVDNAGNVTGLAGGQGGSSVVPSGPGVTPTNLVAGILGAKVLRHNLSIAAKSPARFAIELQGLLWTDSDGDQSEAGTAW